MTNQEIHDEIVENEKMIDILFDPSRFDLQLEVIRLRQRNEELQSMCTHDFRDKPFCYYCYKLKTE